MASATEEGRNLLKFYGQSLNVGFTLTGCDELEPGAASNHDRINAMQKIHSLGIKTWASIEPIVDLGKSWNMICETKDFCDFYRIGLMSGKRNYTPKEVIDFCLKVEDLLPQIQYIFKQSVIDFTHSEIMKLEGRI